MRAIHLLPGESPTTGRALERAGDPQRRRPVRFAARHRRPRGAAPRRNPDAAGHDARRRRPFVPPPSLASVAERIPTLAAAVLHGASTEDDGEAEPSADHRACREQARGTSRPSDATAPGRSSVRAVRVRRGLDRPDTGSGAAAAAEADPADRGVPTGSRADAVRSPLGPSRATTGRALSRLASPSPRRWFIRLKGQAARRSDAGSRVPPARTWAAHRGPSGRSAAPACGR